MIRQGGMVCIDPLEGKTEHDPDEFCTKNDLNVNLKRQSLTVDGAGFEPGWTPAVSKPSL